MGFFSNWPYSNLHNLNLDWIIKIVKDLQSKYDEVWNRVKPVDPGQDPGTITAAQAYEEAVKAGEEAGTAVGKADTAIRIANQAKSQSTSTNTALENHTGNYSNPHEVTGEQVGAYQHGSYNITGPGQQHTNLHNNVDEFHIDVYGSSENLTSYYLKAPSAGEANTSRMLSSYNTDGSFSVGQTNIATGDTSVWRYGENLLAQGNGNVYVIYGNEIAMIAANGQTPAAKAVYVGTDSKAIEFQIYGTVNVLTSKPGDTFTFTNNANTKAISLTFSQDGNENPTIVTSNAGTVFYIDNTGVVHFTKQPVWPASANE